MKKYGFILIATALLMVACEEGDDQEKPFIYKEYIETKETPTPEPTPEEKRLTVNTTSLSFGAAKESKTFIITSNTDWTVSKPEWCALSKDSGTGNETITVTIEDNPNTAIRSGVIIVTAIGVSSIHTINISQDAKPTPTPDEPTIDDNQPPA